MHTKLQSDFLLVELPLLSPLIYRALKGEFGITGKKLGLWDYTLFEIGIIEIRSEIGIMGFHTKPIFSFYRPLMQGNRDNGITAQWKLG